MLCLSLSLQVDQTQDEKFKIRFMREAKFSLVHNKTEQNCNNLLQGRILIIIQNTYVYIIVHSTMYLIQQRRLQRCILILAVINFRQDMFQSSPDLHLGNNTTSPRVKRKRLVTVTSILLIVWNCHYEKLGIFVVLDSFDQIDIML